MGAEKEGLPPISNATKAKLDRMNLEQLQASIKESTGLKSCGRSIYRGVCSQQGRWRAQIKTSGKTKYLGTHETEEAAARAYDRAAVAKDGK